MLRELIRVGDGVVKMLCYEHLLNLIVSGVDAAKLIIDVIEREYPEVASQR